MNKETTYDFLIIGAGAAGLMAMRELLEAGHKVCILEAADIAGGRIVSIREKGFNDPVEAGAEFIHGKLPRTMKLLDEANIPYHEVTGNMISVKQGQWLEEIEEDDEWENFMKKLQQLDEDMTIYQFLEKNFPSKKYANLHKKVKDFAEGFDLADINKASILSVKKEWSQINEIQLRVTGGYIRLVEYLLDQIKHRNGEIHFNTSVKKIDYDNEVVSVYSTDNKIFFAKKVIVTVSLGVLKSGIIEFSPSLKEHAVAIQQHGFGTVIKILLQFKTSFWKKENDDIGFILSDEEIPTWWTQSDDDNKLLTGWVGGPQAEKKSNMPDEEILKESLKSLASIFKCSLSFLDQQLENYKIINWINQPYIKGGYSYDTLESPNAKRILAEPVDGKIFFAGEAVFEGESRGTVEAALESGHSLAGMLKNKNPVQ